MRSDVAITVEGLGKRYVLGRSGSGQRTLREEILRLVRPDRRSGVADEAREHWALRDLSFEVRHGEVLGVIGRNGAGKSTLLKILSRVAEPTTGGVDIAGRVGSLLEVGTGFHPELTGRENIFLSGAVLGMRRREIAAKLDEIVAFAGVERFLDTPCKHYSSGMYARLGFAVAAHLATDILLVDEVLAVGDAEFKARCLSKMGELSTQGGRTIILVSHEPALVRSLCSRALLLAEGRLAFDGSTDDAFRRYNADRAAEGGRIADAFPPGRGGVKLLAARVNGDESRLQALAADAERVDIELDIEVSEPVRAEIEARLCDRDGRTLAFFSPGHMTGAAPVLAPGFHRIRRAFVLPKLLRGAFSLRIGLSDPNVEFWFEATDAVFLDAEGATTLVGALGAGAHSGYFLLQPASPR
jgi:lipopolysaccharide transport system ATP-binding protein